MAPTEKAEVKTASLHAASPHAASPKAAVRRATVGPSKDGRRRRSEDTRRRLFEAMVELLRETNDMPTIGTVALRAGVGLRTLYQHFPDSMQLYAATFDHVVATTLAGMPPVSPDGPLVDRIAGFVDRRSRVCETWAPLWRVGLGFAARDEAIAGRVTRVAQLLRARARILYAPELSDLPPRQQEMLLDAVLSLTEMEAWTYLRTRGGHDVEAARALWRWSLGRLFAGRELLPA